MSDVMNLVKELVELKGYKVLHNTKVCKDWRSEHENCIGCESENGCKEMCNIAMELYISTKES